MALPNEIQTQNLGVLLQRHFGIVAAGSPSPTLASSIIPTAVLENDPPEYGFLKGKRFAYVEGNVAAGGAGTFATAGLQNTTGSGVLAVVTRITLNETGVTAADVYLTASGLPGTPLAPTTRDTRWGVGFIVGKPAIKAAKGAVPAAPPEPPVLYFPGNRLERVDVAFVISPGWSLWIQASTANAALALAAFEWYELAPLAAELAQIG